MPPGHLRLNIRKATLEEWKSHRAATGLGSAWDEKRALGVYGKLDESKGTASDRSGMLAAWETHPDERIRLMALENGTFHTDAREWLMLTRNSRFSEWPEPLDCAARAASWERFVNREVASMNAAGEIMNPVVASILADVVSYDVLGVKDAWGVWPGGPDGLVAPVALKEVFRGFVRWIESADPQVLESLSRMETYSPTGSLPQHGLRELIAQYTPLAADLALFRQCKRTWRHGAVAAVSANVHASAETLAFAARLVIDANFGKIVSPELFDTTRKFFLTLATRGISFPEEVIADLFDRSPGSSISLFDSRIKDVLRVMGRPGDIGVDLEADLLTLRGPSLVRAISLYASKPGNGGRLAMAMNAIHPSHLEGLTRAALVPLMTYDDAAVRRAAIALSARLPGLSRPVASRKI